MVQIYVYITIGVIFTVICVVLLLVFREVYLKISEWNAAVRRDTLFADLRSLRIVEWSDEMAGNDSCSLCLDTFGGREEVLLLPCEHGYHIPCIEERIARGNLYCPVCNAEIIPNGRSYTARDFRFPGESIDIDEEAPLIQPTIFQRINLTVGHRYLRIPSDVEESSREPTPPPPPPPPPRAHLLTRSLSFLSPCKKSSFFSLRKGSESPKKVTEGRKLGLESKFPEGSSSSPALTASGSEPTLPILILPSGSGTSMSALLTPASRLAGRKKEVKVEVHSEATAGPSHKHTG